MWILIVIIIVAGTVAAGASLLWDKEKPLPVKTACTTCSPTSKCEQDCMMEAAIQEIEYFDDEALDAYKGRRSDDYSDSEVVAFREVMETLAGDDLRAWQRSLVRRGIAMPDALKDEYILLATEG